MKRFSWGGQPLTIESTGVNRENSTKTTQSSHSKQISTYPGHSAAFKDGCPPHLHGVCGARLPPPVRSPGRCSDALHPVHRRAEARPAAEGHSQQRAPPRRQLRRPAQQQERRCPPLIAGMGGRFRV